MPVNSVIGRCGIDLLQKILLKWTLKCLNENCKAESAHIMYLIVSHILCGLASVFHPTISIFLHFTPGFTVPAFRVLCLLCLATILKLNCTELKGIFS